MCCIDAILQWPWNTIWTAFAAIGTVGTLGLMAWPKFKLWYENDEKKNILESFFENYEDNSKEQIDLYIHNFRTMKYDGAKSKECNKLVFFKNKPVMLNEYSEVYVNETLIPKGYHLYHVVSRDTIRVDIINNENIYCAYIIRSNSTPGIIDVFDSNKITIFNNLNTNGDGRGNFQKIVDWHIKD